MVDQLSWAFQGQRAPLVFPDCLGNLVYLVTMETRVQRVPGVLLGSRAWMAFLVSREKRVTEVLKGKWVYLGERAAHLDLQDPLDLQDKSSTNLEEMGELELRGEQELQVQQERRVTREMRVLLDTPPRVRRASLGSSWAQTGDLCTWAAWLANREIQDPQVQWGLRAQPDRRDRRERLVSQVNRVVLV